MNNTNNLNNTNNSNNMGVAYVDPHIAEQLRVPGEGEERPIMGFNSMPANAIPPAAEYETIVCPGCGKTVRSGKFCEYCAYKFDVK